MAQQFDYPKTETELRKIQDRLYQQSKEVYDAGGRPAWKGLLEIMSAKTTIVTAIHNIKSNRGSETPGVDEKRMRKDYLQRPFSVIIREIQAAFRHFEAEQIRRVYIDKPGKAEKRPLGIPTVWDRIIQECMRIVLEPICEAQFFAHSYGFRPMRDTAMALERITFMTHNTGYRWIVEGDISKCFDRIDHAILLKRLYQMGVKDRRVLQIIKAMLKAGVMDICEVNEDGTPQGGLISPLLANVYLDIMDEWVTAQWENKRTRFAYSRPDSKIRGLIQYYQCCTWVNIAMKKYARKLSWAAIRRLKQYKGKWIPADQTQNLPRVHQEYRQKIPAIKYRDIYVGITELTFCRWRRTPGKNQAETPFTDSGRQLYFERTKKKRIQARLDEMYSDHAANIAVTEKWGKLNNFEFFMNRGYALNRDKVKCRVCGGWLIECTPYVHRINPNLPLNKVNRVNNLVSVHKKCLHAINDPQMDITEFDAKAQRKIIGYREKLVLSQMAGAGTVNGNVVAIVPPSSGAVPGSTSGSTGNDPITDTSTSTAPSTTVGFTEVTSALYYSNGSLGTRTYAVNAVTKVSVNDVSGLDPSSTNMITLYTCVEDQPAYRWCVTATETV